MRWNAPWGAVLLILPCWWGLAVAGGGNVYSYILFALGGILMRSFGCIINDLWDSKIDRQVPRTATRPLASGKLSALEAMAVATLLLLGSAWVLLQLEPMIFPLALAVLPLVILYPLAKRVFFLPQLILGMIFNWGVWLGWVAGTNPFFTANSVVVLLYFAGVFWTLFYDGIYSLQDKHADEKLGLKSFAILFQSRIKTALAVCGASNILLFALAGVLNNPTIYFGVIMVMITGMYSYILKNLKIANAASAKGGFIGSMWIGVLAWVGLLV